MTCAILGLPLTSVLITTILLGSDGVKVMPVVIVAVVVAYVGRAHLSPQPRTATPPVDGSPPRPSAAPLNPGLDSEASGSRSKPLA